MRNNPTKEMDPGKTLDLFTEDRNNGDEMSVFK